MSTMSADVEDEDTGHEKVLVNPGKVAQVLAEPDMSRCAGRAKGGAVKGEGRVRAATPFTTGFIITTCTWHTKPLLQPKIHNLSRAATVTRCPGHAQAVACRSHADQHTMQ